MSKGILIIGATGQQGGALVDALLAANPGAWGITILAVTRDPMSTSAQKLQAKSKAIKIVKGDLSDAPALFTAAKAQHDNVWGVFSVQTPKGKGGAQLEEDYGKALIDAAVKNDVEQFVQTSVDRGGDASDSTPTNVPHFVSKHNIEQYLKEKTKDTITRYTILRPVAFMENFQPGFPSSVFGALLRDRLPVDRKLQLISVRDIGWFAAQAFLVPEKYRDRAISIAGDELSFQQLNEVFLAETGKPFPATYGFFGTLLTLVLREFGVMMAWIAENGYQADIKACRAVYPKMLDMQTWLAKYSGFVKRT